jgi:hypothetical protein
VSSRRLRSPASPPLSGWCNRCMQVEAMASSASTAAVTELHWIFNKAITCWGYELSRLSACACAGDTYTRCAPSLVLGNCTTIGLSLLYSGSSAIFTRLVALHIEAHYSTSPKLSEKMCGPETHYTPFSISFGDVSFHLLWPCSH